MTELRMVRDDVSHSAVVAHLLAHLAEMHEVSPPGSVHALDLDALTSSDIRFWSAWSGDELVGTVALKDVGDGDVEIKSMRTSERSRRTGVGRQLLKYVLAEAAASGARRVLLETGSQPYFFPARTLYASAGFTECGPFAQYVEDPNSVFMVLSLR